MARLRRTIIAPRALRDLRAIRRWLAREAGKPTADALLARVPARARIYAERPMAGRDESLLEPSVRSFVVPPYIVYYRPGADGIALVRVIHGARDIPRAWREPEPDPDA
jgi:toxin ParE1/3/4